MKMKKIAAFACAAAFALCLAGCGSNDESKDAETAEPEQEAAEVEQDAAEAVALDKEVSIGRLTAMVSSEWTEEQPIEETLNYFIEGDKFFGLCINSQEGCAYKGIEEYINLQNLASEKMGWENFLAMSYGEDTVDGLPCEFMAASRDYDNDGEIIRATTYSAYVFTKEDGDYWIVSSNDWDLLNQILDTVTIA